MDLLSREQIIFNRDFNEKVEILRLITDRALVLGITDDAEGLMEGFLERESLGPTGVGDGIAIPHAKSASVTRVSVMIVKSEVPVLWESFDGSPVTIALALLVPEDRADNIHLKVLSNLTRKLVNRQFKQDLFAASTPEQVMELFQEFSLEN